MDKVFYYYRMTNIPIIKSSTDLDNKELFPISSSSSQKVWKSSDNDTEYGEENIDTDDPDTSDSDILERSLKNKETVCSTPRMTVIFG